jgi:hypothetical protein
MSKMEDKPKMNKYLIPNQRTQISGLGTQQPSRPCQRRITLSNVKSNERKGKDSPYIYRELRCSFKLQTALGLLH